MAQNQLADLGEAAGREVSLLLAAVVYGCVMWLLAAGCWLLATSC